MVGLVRGGAHRTAAGAAGLLWAIVRWRRCAGMRLADITPEVWNGIANELEKVYLLERWPRAKARAKWYGNTPVKNRRCQH